MFYCKNVFPQASPDELWPLQRWKKTLGKCCGKEWQVSCEWASCQTGFGSMGPKMQEDQCAMRRPSTLLRGSYLKQINTGQAACRSTDKIRDCWPTIRGSSEVNLLLLEVKDGVMKRAEAAQLPQSSYDICCFAYPWLLSLAAETQPAEVWQSCGSAKQGFGHLQKRFSWGKLFGAKTPQNLDWNLGSESMLKLPLTWNGGKKIN